jgi:hypothetical protein
VLETKQNKTNKTKSLIGTTPDNNNIVKDSNRPFAKNNTQYADVKKHTHTQKDIHYY